MRGPLPVSGLSMNIAWPAPAGDHSTRQWLTRSTTVLPPSFDKRMNEFSPVITTSCWSTHCASAIYGSLSLENLCRSVQVLPARFAHDRAAIVDQLAA